MKSASSPVPILSPVLFYTPSDSYNVQTDNRPVYNLQTNLQSLAASLVGVGYGEHAASQGGYLTPGKAVRLLENGMIRYPNASDIGEAGVPYGIIIGSTAAGLNKVIWNSRFLDTTYLGLEDYFSGAVVGQYIEVTFDSSVQRNYNFVTSPTNTNHVMGKIVSSDNSIISIGKEIDTADSETLLSQTNYHNLFGFTRLRNLLLYVDNGSTPIQFSKITTYQSSVGSANSSINLMNAQLTSSGTITAGPASSITYDSAALRWKVKETFSRLLVNGIDKISGSSWPDLVYATKLTTVDGSGQVENLELQKVGSAGTDYSTTTNIELYKQFKIVKYYQYAKVAPGSLTYGKPTVIATVFDPEGSTKGGEATKVIVWDFLDYDLATGLEISQRRVVSTGISATTLYDNIDIFPVDIKAV